MRKPGYKVSTRSAACQDEGEEDEGRRSKTPTTGAGVAKAAHMRPTMPRKADQHKRGVQKTPAPPSVQKTREGEANTQGKADGEPEGKSKPGIHS